MAEVFIGSGKTISVVSNPINWNILHLDATGTLDLSTVSAGTIATFANDGIGGNGLIITNDKGGAFNYPNVTTSDNFRTAAGTGWGTIRYVAPSTPINLLSNNPNVEFDGSAGQLSITADFKLSEFNSAERCEY